MRDRSTTPSARTARIPGDWWLVPAGLVLFGLTALGAVRPFLG